MKEGKIWEIPSETYPPIEQGAVVLKSAKNKNAARAFLDFVSSPAGRKILEKHGFTIPATTQP
jgi:molybdate transport system substrate-binding protein